MIKDRNTTVLSTDYQPTESLKGRSSKQWFSEIVESEIKPLLKEYWFESQDEADKAVAKLLENL